VTGTARIPTKLTAYTTTMTTTTALPPTPAIRRNPPGAKDVARPDCARRKVEYKARSPVEEFATPLVKQDIESNLRLHAANPAPGSRALDAGCGRQPFRGELERMGYAYTSMDVVQSPENSVDFLAVIDGELPAGLLERGPFDFVLCTEVLEHVADWNTAFANLFQLTAPGGGKVLITCPFFYPLHEEPYDYWRPTYHCLKAHAERVGFEFVSYSESGSAWDIIGTLIAHCHVTPASRRLFDRGVAHLVRWGKEGMFRLLRSGWLQRRAKLRGRIYMTNAVVLQKP
jgi:SAM-dependent methyltransferase